MGTKGTVSMTGNENREEDEINLYFKKIIYIVVLLMHKKYSPGSCNNLGWDPHLSLAEECWIVESKYRLLVIFDWN
jgi:hypothetical protein